MVKINGKLLDAAGMTIAEYIASTDYKKETIAVERNEEIVPKNDYDKVVLMDDDCIEIVSFVGGG